MTTSEESKKTMISIIFFDLGNTVLDYHRGPLTDMEKDQLGLLRLQARLESLGYPQPYDRLYNEFFIPWMEALKKRKTSKQEFPIEPFLCRAIPTKVVERAFHQLMLDFCEPNSRLAVPMADIGETLPMLSGRNIEVGLISNTPVPGFCHDYALERIGLLKYFAHRIYSYDIGHRKPSVEIFITAMARAGTTPENCIMVGDSMDLDIEPALEIGMRTCHYTTNERTISACTKQRYARISKFQELTEMPWL